jgi:LPXTG-motif cell wall-anchored protein
MRWFSAVLASTFLLAMVTVASAQSGPVTIKLPAANGSGESGTVTLTPSGSNITELVIVLNNQPLLHTQYDTIGGQQVIKPSTYGGAAPQLASIYSGTCNSYTPTNPPNLGALTPYSPNVTSNGWLVVKMPLADILSGHYVIAVHKDTTDTSPLVACAALVAGPEISATTLPQTGSPRAALGVLAGAGVLVAGLGGWMRRRAVTMSGPRGPGVCPSDQEVLR